MRNLLIVGLVLIALNGIRAEEPKRTPTEKQLLAEKLVELEKLQGEIDRLRRKTGEPPQQVLVRVRAVEIKTGKLQQAGLSHPLQSIPGPTPTADAAAARALPSPAGNGGYQTIKRESLDEVLQKLDACVKQGFAKTLTDASMLTVAGRHERMLSGSDVSIPLSRPDASRENQSRFVGLELQLLSRVNANRQITLNCDFKWSEKDFIHIVKSGDTIVPGIRSRSLSTQFQMNSQETVVFSGLVSGENAARETEFACLITCELVSGIGF